MSDPIMDHCYGPVSWDHRIHLCERLRALGGEEWERLRGLGGGAGRGGGWEKKIALKCKHACPFFHFVSLYVGSSEHINSESQQKRFYIYTIYALSFACFWLVRLSLCHLWIEVLLYEIKSLEHHMLLWCILRVLSVSVSVGRRSVQTMLAPQSSFKQTISI